MQWSGRAPAPPVHQGNEPFAVRQFAVTKFPSGPIASLRTAGKLRALSARGHADILTVWSSCGELQINQIEAAKARGLPQTPVIAADDCSQKRYPRRAACHTPAQDWPEDSPRHVPLPLVDDSRPWPTADEPPAETLTETAPLGKTRPLTLADSLASVVMLPLLICTP
jgi:hypothetical protein